MSIARPLAASLALFAPALAGAGSDTPAERAAALGLEGTLAHHVLYVERELDAPFVAPLPLATRASYDWTAAQGRMAETVIAHLEEADEGGALAEVETFFATPAGQAYAELRQRILTPPEAQVAGQQLNARPEGRPDAGSAVYAMKVQSVMRAYDQHLAPAHARARVALTEVLVPKIEEGPLAAHLKEPEPGVELPDGSTVEPSPSAGHDPRRWLEHLRERAADPAEFAPGRELREIQQVRLGHLSQDHLEVVAIFYESRAGAWYGEAVAAAVAAGSRAVARDRVAHMEGLAERVDPGAALGDQDALVTFVRPFLDAAVPCRPGDGACFFLALGDCREAEATFSMRRVAYRYEILGATEEACRIRMSFPLNPNPEWVGEPMTCHFPDSPTQQTLMEAHETLLEENPYRCEGPLADRIRDL